MVWWLVVGSYSCCSSPVGVVYVSGPSDVYSCSYCVGPSAVGASD